MTNHTPLPWRIENKAKFRIVAGQDDTVASTACQSSLTEDWTGNAELIVQCVNAHDDLVKMLEEARDAMIAHCAGSVLETLDRINIALASAKGQP